jgi:hypothetical protein
MPLSRMALKWGFDRAGLGDVPGLDYEKMVAAIEQTLAENDVTQFFGKIHEATANWEREHAKRFPSDYAVIRIHPYAFNCYLRNWPPEHIRFLAGIGRPTDVLGVPIQEDTGMFRTSWELQLGGKLLEHGEVLEIVQ